MKLWQIIVLVALAAAILAGIGYSYKATYDAGHSGGYNQRVGEESKAYADAEDKGRKAQSQADQQRIGDLQQALTNERDAETQHQQQLDRLSHDNADLTRRLNNAKSNPDAARWLAEPIPAAVLCSVQWASAGPGSPANCPSH